MTDSRADAAAREIDQYMFHRSIIVGTEDHEEIAAIISRHFADLANAAATDERLLKLSVGDLVYAVIHPSMGSEFATLFTNKEDAIKRRDSENAADRAFGVDPLRCNAWAVKPFIIKEVQE